MHISCLPAPSRTNVKKAARAIQKSSFCRDLRKIGEITVGFCFSFPVSHISIKSGKIIKWTKGFENEGAVGSDPVKLLTSAFQREVHISQFEPSECQNILMKPPMYLPLKLKLPNKLASLEARKRKTFG